MLKTINHNGVRMSSVGIGTWAIGGPYWTDGDPTGWSGPLDDDDSVKGLTLAMEQGLTHVDTADVYGHGRSERLVARALSMSPSDYTLASKVGFIPTSAPSVYSPENIRFQCEQSLRNLAVETIDIYYLHHCDFGVQDRFLPGAMNEVKMLKQEGKIRSISLSGYSASDLIRVATVLQPDFIQSWASIEHPEFIREDGPLVAFMRSNNIKFIAMMPFGQGRLLAKYNPKKPPTFGAGDTRSGNTEFHARSLAQVESRLNAMQRRFGRLPADLITPALGFVLKHEIVASVIPGFRNSGQVQEICEAVKRPFTDEDLSFIETLFPFSQATPHPWQE